MNKATTISEVDPLFSQGDDIREATIVGSGEPCEESSGPLKSRTIKHSNPASGSGEGSYARSQEPSDGEQYVLDLIDGLTTIMIDNLEPGTSHEDLLRCIDEIGCGGTYDLVYIPRRGDHFFRYAFINFINPVDATHFVCKFSQFSFEPGARLESAYVRISKVQRSAAIMALIEREGVLERPEEHLTKLRDPAFRNHSPMLETTFRIDRLTTLMISNLQPRTSQEDFLRGIDEIGCACTYDLVYIPRKGNQFLRCGFINFVKPVDATNFLINFLHFSFEPGAPLESAYVGFANIQGFAAIIELIEEG